MLTKRPLPPGQPSVNAMSGTSRMSQFLLTALVALAISFLTFAASFAEVPRSEILVIEAER